MAPRNYGIRSLTAAALFAMASFGPTGSYVEALPQEVSSRKVGCVHGPRSRDCWDDDHDIATDYNLNWPNTGKVAEVRLLGSAHIGSIAIANTISPQYHLEITNTTAAPDGFERLMMLVNGQFPGPTIQAGKPRAS